MNMFRIPMSRYQNHSIMPFINQNEPRASPFDRSRCIVNIEYAFGNFQKTLGASLSPFRRSVCRWRRGRDGFERAALSGHGSGGNQRRGAPLSGNERLHVFVWCTTSRRRPRLHGEV